MPKLGLSFTILFLLSQAVASFAQTDYQPGPDSLPQAGVPKGEVLKFIFDHSKIFPGTTREYWIYIPAQYRPDTSACLYVSQDGIKAAAPTVFDNLINKKEMPVTIGVFVMHGRVATPDTNSGQDRYNRSFEYDGLGDNYVRFLLEELLPDVETKTASDGRAIRLSRNAADRAIGGESSGAIAAFTAAWDRPDAFSRVFSAIGTYVGLRGGEIYPTLIRKYEPKPIRVYLQDGSNDLNIYAGDWWMANQTMERALVFSGYEVDHVWGDNGHNGKHSTSIFPDAMRWLWKDWPKPVKNLPTKNGTLVEIIIPGEKWEIAPKSERGTFGPDNKRYIILVDKKRILSYGVESKKAKLIASGISGAFIAIGHNGNAYVTEPSTNKVWLINPDGKKSVVDTGLQYPSGVTFSADQTQLFVADAHSHWVYIYSIKPDGTLTNKQQYFWLHSPDNLDWSGAGGMQVDDKGRLYIATAMGIQIADQPGRVQCIIPTPNGRADDLTFSSSNRDTIVATSGDETYKRKFRIKGLFAWDNPTKPPVPSL